MSQGGMVSDSGGRGNLCVIHSKLADIGHCPRALKLVDESVIVIAHT